MSTGKGSVCAACGEPASYADEDGCVGTLPKAYHFKAGCLLEAYRREASRCEVVAARLRQEAELHGRNYLLSSLLRDLASKLDGGVSSGSVSGAGGTAQ